MLDMAEESHANDATGKEKASKVSALESSSPLPSKWRLWWTTLPTLRNWFGAVLFGMGIGVELDIGLTNKLGWRPQDYKAHILSSLLILASLVLENLKLRKKKRNNANRGKGVSDDN